jgi:hypothetical protein
VNRAERAERALARRQLLAWLVPLGLKVRDRLRRFPKKLKGFVVSAMCRVIIVSF